MAEDDIISKVASQHGIDEAFVVYASRVDVRDWVHVRARLECPETAKSCRGYPEETRRLLKEFAKAVVLIGSGDAFKTRVIDVERSLRERGFPRALAFINGHNEHRPCLLNAGIDMLSTIKRFKKNFDKPVETWAIVLLE